MLYIDQPVSVGFSFNEIVASTLDQLTGLVSPIDSSLGAISTNTTFVKGLLPSQDINAFPNTTANAAKVLWRFTQIWLQEFPEHKSSDDRVSIWANSVRDLSTFRTDQADGKQYGGHWGPVTMAHFESQNRKIRNHTLSSPLRNATLIHLDTLGITNGCVDAKIEAPTYLQMAINNTYGLQTITEDDHQSASNNITKREPFDISRPSLSVYPPYYTIGFMNQNWVQKDLRASVNFTLNSNNVANMFLGGTGDVTVVSIDIINYVAQSGIKVALVFGDRDYRCNWFGGEAVSLAMEHESSVQFRKAGYAPITTNSTYQGGVVRQYNGTSFSRVFDAGHAVGAYQPETVSKIFDRVMLNKDVATGKIGLGDAPYSSEGPVSSFEIKNVLPTPLENECYTWAVTDTCTAGQIAALANGTAVVRDYIVREH
ncbi:hypothetical protein SLS60_008227 [Paraconiothyrium brasiliense]|uniref:Alpha/beta-hydrolase n=1 Tax=Paraconiothyrium brasiliense TaxID=300254 RepID=A0ABR3R002_9PLEO